PVAHVDKIDTVFAVVDTAVKTGKDNDGTAAVYFGYSKTGVGAFKHHLFILDWDIVQIEGAMLDAWLPGVFQNLEHLARDHGARMGSLGAFIEDQQTGSILIQQARKKRWPAQAIDGALTAMGKDER